MGSCTTGLTYMHGFGGFPGMMLLWIAVIIAIVYFVTRNRSSITSNIHSLSIPSSKKDALEILLRRYAHGEISDEEFETKRRRIMQEIQ